jgi:GMP synthase (glutamine-hydrolysing)
MRPVLVIEQERSLEGLGLLGERLDASGLPYRRLQMWRERIDGLRPRDFAGVVPMGGNAHAWEEDGHAFLSDERRFLGAAVDQAVPVLAICLGAQILARSLGADVRAGEAPEIGWLDIEPTEDAGEDPLFAHMSGPAGVYQWHYDAFELPPGARRLAQSELYPNQAFRLGDADAWGIQFHPEVDPDIWEIWISRHPNEVREAGVDVDALRDDVHSGAELSRSFREGLFDAFLEVVRARRAVV